MRAGIPAIALVAVIAIAGCGGAASRTAPAKAQFTVRADVICRRENEKLHRAAAVDHTSLASFNEVPRLIRQAVAIHRAANAQLESLPKPAGEDTTITRWLTARTVAATLELDTAEAPVGEDSIAAADIRIALARARASVRALSHRYGFRVCGETE